MGCSSQTVRNAIHDFNDRALDALVAESSRPERIRAAFDEKATEGIEVDSASLETERACDRSYRGQHEAAATSAVTLSPERKVTPLRRLMCNCRIQ